MLLNLLKTPVPLTPTELVEQSGIYKKDKKTPSLLYSRYLKPLIFMNLVFEYKPDMIVWSDVISLIKYRRRELGAKIPRKIEKVFQIHFLYLLSDFSFIIKPPLFSPENNFYMCLLVHKHLYGKEIEEPFWNFVNLFLSYIHHPETVVQKIYEIPFYEHEREVLLNVLEESKDVSDWIGSLPFKPDLDKALEFLEYF
jgi:hypothetical protein